MICGANSSPSIYILTITPSGSKWQIFAISISHKYLQINILTLCLWLKVMHVVTEIYDALKKTF